MRPETRVFVVITLLRDDCLLCNSVLRRRHEVRGQRALELEIFLTKRVLHIILLAIVRDIIYV